MSQTTMHYAVYDISDDPTRTSVADALKNSGFVRVQKSVFCGTLSGQSKKDLLERVRLILARPDGEDGADSFYLIMTCAACYGNIETIGEAFDPEYASGETPAMVF
ncbi:MAG: CRISPR-associated endonuclease Cas2 [Thaumarchaeota archaeon S14]|nr:MAG: CRISPR-associated endonuclease Cas2 [Thaumarchaeota archaeon S14]